MSKDIDNLFSDKMNEEIKNEIKARRKKLDSKLITKAILMTLITLVASYLLLGFVSKKYIEYRFHKSLSEKSIEYSLMYPNEYIGKQSYVETGLFKYSSTYNITKKLGSRSLYAGSITESVSPINFGIQGQSFFIISEAIPKLDNSIDNRKSTPFGLRNLYFMMPYVDYENTINDFHYLNEIQDNKFVEMVLSFDKEYSYEEVNSLLDSNLITFYWIDNDYKGTKENYKESKYYHTGDSVIGVKSHNYAGDIIVDVNERMNIFIAALQHFKESKFNGLLGNIDENNIKISGVVVHGNPDELKKLQENKIIKHAILGTVADKY